MLQVTGVVSNRPSAAASLITVTVAAGEPALVAVTITIVIVIVTITIVIVSGGLTDRFHDYLNWSSIQIRDCGMACSDNTDTSATRFDCDDLKC